MQRWPLLALYVSGATGGRIPTHEDLQVISDDSHKPSHATQQHPLHAPHTLHALPTMPKAHAAPSQQQQQQQQHTSSGHIDVAALARLHRNVRKWQESASASALAAAVPPAAATAADSVPHSMVMMMMETAPPVTNSAIDDQLARISQQLHGSKQQPPPDAAHSKVEATSKNASTELTPGSSGPEHLWGATGSGGRRFDDEDSDNPDGTVGGRRSRLQPLPATTATSTTTTTNSTSYQQQQHSRHSNTSDASCLLHISVLSAATAEQPSLLATLDASAPLEDLSYDVAKHMSSWLLRPRMRRTFHTWGHWAAAHRRLRLTMTVWRKHTTTLRLYHACISAATTLSAMRLQRRSIRQWYSHAMRQRRVAASAQVRVDGEGVIIPVLLTPPMFVTSGNSCPVSPTCSAQCHAQVVHHGASSAQLSTTQPAASPARLAHMHACIQSWQKAAPSCNGPQVEGSHGLPWLAANLLARLA